LCKNPAAIHILKANPDRIFWTGFSQNPEIFEYDYKRMTRPFTEELMAILFHPSNIERFEAWGYE
jgi:hypothetical protein